MTIGRDSRTLAVLFAVGVANAVLLLALVGDTTGWRGARDGVYVAVAVGFAVAFGVVVFIRDRSPRVVLVITILVVCSYYIVGLPSIGVVLPLLASLVAVTLAGHRSFAVGAALAFSAVATYFRLRQGETVEAILGYELLANLTFAGLAIVLAEVVKARRELQESQEHVVALASDAARKESERKELAQRARIARALHDDLGHSLAIISLHANASAELLPPDHPASVLLGHVQAAASRGLQQLRGAVRGLSDDKDEARPRRAPLENLDAMVDGLRAGGITVTVRRAHGALPAMVESAAFEIIQEAITNALRHADAPTVHLAIEAIEAAGDAPARLRIEVRNEGAAVEGSRNADVRVGRGLAGIRTRVDDIGGDVEWGFRDPNQFIVQAMLPLSDAGR